MQYRLISMVEHSGSLSSGHYTATVHDEEVKQWFHISDTKHFQVRFITHGSLIDSVQTAEASVQGAEAYLLFYELIL